MRKGKQYAWHIVTLAVLTVCSAVCPPLAFLLAFLMPMVACPWMAGGGIRMACLLAIAPALGFVLGGGDPYLCAALLLPPALCLCAEYARRKGLPFNAYSYACMAGVMAGLLAAAVRLRWYVGGDLAAGLAGAAVDAIGSSPKAGIYLYRLMAGGILSMPSAYGGAQIMQVGSAVVMDAALQSELLAMLRLRLSELIGAWLPSLMVQASAIIGLFTAILAEKARVRRFGADLPTPSFQTLHLPKRERGYVTVMCLGALLLQLTDSPVLLLTGELMYAAFVTVFELLGASVLVFMLSRKHPRRTALYGVIAAALYLIFPLALFLVGVTDQFLNLRVSAVHQQKEESSK